MDIEDKIKKDEPLANRSSFGIGGPAAFYIEVESKDDLLAALAWAEKEQYKTFILGGGSNILISDQGFSGLVIKLNNSEIKIMNERMQLGAGALLPNAVRQAASHDLSGLEWAVGIPGTIGGALRGNAGAHNSDIAANTENVEVYDVKKKKFSLFSRKDCFFAYRHSIFKDMNNLIVWQATLKLNKTNSTDINKQMSQYLEKRIRTQPKLPSAGSIFKNISLDEIKNNNPGLLAEAEKEGIIKNNLISAGWVIGQLDIAGKKIGGAKISLEHNNFVVNTGQATAEDIIILISFIKQQVRDNLKIELKEEINYIGFD